MSAVLSLLADVTPAVTAELFAEVARKGARVRRLSVRGGGDSRWCMVTILADTRAGRTVTVSREESDEGAALTETLDALLTLLEREQGERSVPNPRNSDVFLISNNDFAQHDVDG
jgi:hypothetical protein